MDSTYLQVTYLQFLWHSSFLLFWQQHVIERWCPDISFYKALMYRCLPTICSCCNFVNGRIMHLQYDVFVCFLWLKDTVLRTPAALVLAMMEVEHKCTKLSKYAHSCLRYKVLAELYRTESYCKLSVLFISSWILL